jgi:hypothetical protein
MLISSLAIEENYVRLRFSTSQKTPFFIVTAVKPQICHVHYQIVLTYFESDAMERQRTSRTRNFIFKSTLPIKSLASAARR